VKKEMSKHKHHKTDKDEDSSKTSVGNAGKDYRAFADQIHTLIHSARLLPKYSPTNIELRVSDLVIELYSNSCPECKKVGEAKKTQKPKESFFQKLGGALDE
jgi:hypothetical protein